MRKANLEFDLWRWWLGREWKAVLLLVGLSGLVLGLAWYLVGQVQRPSQAEAGVIMRFGTTADYDGDHPIVTVRTDDGRLHQLSVGRGPLLGCRRGDRIALLRRGTLVTVAAAGCQNRPNT